MEDRPKQVSNDVTKRAEDMAKTLANEIPMEDLPDVVSIVKECMTSSLEDRIAVLIKDSKDAINHAESQQKEAERIKEILQSVQNS